jgi:hypothetical protein
MTHEFFKFYMKLTTNTKSGLKPNFISLRRARGRAFAMLHDSLTDNSGGSTTNTSSKYDASQLDMDELLW